MKKLILAIFTFATSLHADIPVLYTDPSATIATHVILSSESPDVNVTEYTLINHLKFAISEGVHQHSKLNPNILKMDGMSSSKTRCFLNALCSLPGTKYLEIGCWKGSTFISALYGNQSSLETAIAIDNLSEYAARDEFISNCRTFIANVPHRFYSHDCFSIDPSAFIKNGINVYFYDGNHSTESHALAFTYFNDVLDDLFITAIDDWNWDHVREGTYQAFSNLGYTVLYEAAMPTRHINDKQTWWNGLYVAVIRKK